MEHRHYPATARRLHRQADTFRRVRPGARAPLRTAARSIFLMALSKRRTDPRPRQTTLWRAIAGQRASPTTPGQRALHQKLARNQSPKVLQLNCAASWRRSRDQCESSPCVSPAQPQALRIPAVLTRDRPIRSSGRPHTNYSCPAFPMPWNRRAATHFRSSTTPSSISRQLSRCPWSDGPRVSNIRRQPRRPPALIRGSRLLTDDYTRRAGYNTLVATVAAPSEIDS